LHFQYGRYNNSKGHHPIGTKEQSSMIQSQVYCSINPACLNLVKVDVYY
jgi:hypothetical protein